MRSLKLFSIFLIVALICVSAYAYEQDPAGKECAIEKHPIKEKRFAVVVEQKKLTSYFDDVGCAIKWRASKCLLTQVTCDAVTYAFDYYSGEPVHVRSAYYVTGSSVKTPQRHGIVALKDEENAGKFLKEFGGNKEVLDFEQIQELVK